MINKIKVHIATFISFIFVCIVSIFSPHIAFEMVKGIEKAVKDLTNE